MKPSLLQVMHDEAADTASRIEAARVLLNQLSLLTVLEIEPMASSTHAGGVPFLVSRVGQAQKWAPRVVGVPRDIASSAHFSK